ncbi:MAG: exodeoxyribonuclease V subunit alpha, partial [Burkholderiaceae bacterium]
LEDSRLYFHRYWQYEQRLANRIRRFIDLAPEPVSLPALLAGGGLFDFTTVAAGQPHWQAVATFMALRHRFAIISGGPGTGKTFTVLRLMVLLIRAALAAGERAPLIKMAAPTGKAAARMAESVITGANTLSIPDDVRAHIPAEASTLHRLLGLGFGTTRPRYDAENTLPADIVIVDEASMVDLSLMAKLAEAVRENARLILLGDRYQLASVEAGSVLSELCQAAGVNAFSAEHIAAGGTLLADIAPAAPSLLGDHVVTLQTSHRFNAESGIGQLAAAINNGEAERTIALLRTGLPDVTWPDDPDASRTSLLDEYGAYRAAQIDIVDPALALDMLQSRVILCAVRAGPFGSNTINREITLRVARARGFDSTRVWYHGRPVIVLRNDYRVGLFNGDAGVCLRDRDGQFRVWFRTDEGLRALLPSTLPDHATLYAMTVHKSQGSEFEQVAMV